MVQFLLRRGASTSQLSERGKTALQIAVECNQLEISQCLLAHDASIVDYHKKGTWSALFHAASCGQLFPCCRPP